MPVILKHLAALWKGDCNFNWQRQKAICPCVQSQRGILVLLNLGLVSDCLVCKWFILTKSFRIGPSIKVTSIKSAFFCHWRAEVVTLSDKITGTIPVRVRLSLSIKELETVSKWGSDCHNSPGDISEQDFSQSKARPFGYKKDLIKGLVL